MTDNTQELDEITSNLWVRYGSPGTMDEFVPEANKVLLDWHNKHIEQIKQNIKSLELDNCDDTDAYQQGYMWAIGQAISVVAERNKLKEAEL